MSPKLLKWLGGVVVTVLTALAASNSYPMLTPGFLVLIGLIPGWLGLTQPGAKEAAENDLIARLEKLEAARLASQAPKEPK